MFSFNAMLIEQAKIVVGLPPRTPSSSTPDYVSMKGYGRCCIIIVVDNATTVTGSAITVKQATAVAGTGEAALSFTKVYQNIDIDAAGGETLAETAVVSDTFTTTAVDNKNAIYVIEIKAEDLNIDGGFDCIRAGTGNATASVLTVIYILYPADFGKLNSIAATTD